VIKINLIREGRAAVRGATGAPGPAAAAGPSNINNVLLVGLLVVGLVLSAGYWFVKHREEVAKQTNCRRSSRKSKTSRSGKTRFRSAST
jgi:hypothetical protein